MKKITALYILFFLTLATYTTFAQNSLDKKLVQFSGVIYDVDSNSVIPYVTLNNITSGKSYAANYKGYYSFIVHEGDSIVFTAVGYKKAALSIPKSIKENKYTAIIKMKSDNIELPMVRVFPWASTDEFRHDFLTMKIADDDLEIAKKNVKKALEDAAVYGIPMDGAEIQQMSFRNQHISLSNKNMVQTNPLLNPLAWAAFIKQISEGSKNKKK